MHKALECRGTGSIPAVALEVLLNISRLWLNVDVRKEFASPECRRHRIREQRRMVVGSSISREKLVKAETPNTIAVFA